MQNFQEKKQELGADKKVHQTAEKSQTTTYQCPNCGTLHSASDNFCSECGAGLNGNSCAHCGAETEPDWEICPACGHNLQAELCSFCGGAMEADNAFCPECGNPRTGIVCPGCHTLNFRSFCRKCNAPLNTQAQEALAEARKDPKMQQVFAIAQELAELEAFLLSPPEDQAAPPEIPELSAENRELINQYKDLLAAFRGQEIQEKTEEPPVETPKPEPKPKPGFSVHIASKEDAMKKYREKLADMQATLASMTPDASLTPQLQRDYYSARKVKVQEPNRLYWVCYAYECCHDYPNECSKPWKGGRYMYLRDEDLVPYYGPA
ncbi:MAG: zinc ribbon domain-containing protein [Culturomica sp.]|jgi:predicted amidophosphoribosyltransferase|nr:zinc ribbon domain-containing protein [Culturomica sp.]